MPGVQERVALVSGAGCGIGRVTAELLAERGAREQDPKVWQESMHINLNGPFFLSRLVLKDMIRQAYGRMVFTSSTAGQVAEYAGSAYTSSKHGLLGLMRSIVQDAGQYGITSNAVLPGWVRTKMAETSADTK